MAVEERKKYNHSILELELQLELNNSSLQLQLQTPTIYHNGRARFSVQKLDCMAEGNAILQADLPAYQSIPRS